MNEEKVRYNVQMPETLREDAKANTKRGDLADEVRDLFRRVAYGADATEQPSELEQKRRELRQVRQQIDELRLKRDQLETRIGAKEQRATRLEEQVSGLEEKRNKKEAALELLENMVTSGERLWPGRIEETAGVDGETAEELYEQLQNTNPELPEEAFTEPELRSMSDRWTD